MQQKNNRQAYVIVVGIILILAIIYLVKGGAFLSNLNLGNYLWVGLFLLCPLMHLFMMKGHNHSSQKHNHSSQDHNDYSQKSDHKH